MLQFSFFDLNHKLLWSGWVPKLTLAKGLELINGDFQPNYSMILSKAEIHFVFEDREGKKDPEKVNLPLLLSPKMQLMLPKYKKEGALRTATLDQTGKISYAELKHPSPHSYIIKHEVSFQTEPNAINTMVKYLDGGYHFARISME